MVLRLQPGQAKLSQEARQREQLNAKQPNDFFTSPDMEAFLSELETKPELPTTKPDTKTKSEFKAPWYMFFKRLLPKFLG